MRETSNEDITRAFNRNAPLYDRWMRLFERYIAVGARSWAVSMAHGQVVEIGVGSGLNLPLYGPAAEHVTGIELSGEMLAIARRRVMDQRIDRIDLQHGDAQALNVPSESADTVLSTFTFCTIPEPLAASREAYRVLRPGGAFILAEHGRPTHALGHAAMRAVEPLCVRISGEHITRDPVPYLTGAGFTLTGVQRGGPGGIIFQIIAHKPGASGSD